MMLEQIKYFFRDINRMLGKHKIRIVIIWLSRGFVGVFIYRFERSLYLVFGPAYKYIRIILVPILNLLQAYSNLDIHYQANIKGGLLILHPSMGVVISGHSIIGEDFTLTGGNVLGVKNDSSNTKIIIGNNCKLGANAVVLGPIKLGNLINVGASACVIKDCPEDGSTLIGVPAKRML